MSVVEAMADRGNLASDCQCAGLLHGRNPWGRCGVPPSMEGEDPSENWFQLENSTEETRELMRLEGKLNATLLFEHGRHQPASMLWVARILLSCLFWERLALG